MIEVFGVHDQIFSIDVADSRTTALRRYERSVLLRGLYTRTQLSIAGGQAGSFPEEGQAALRELRDIQSLLSGFATYSGPMRNDDRIFSVLDVVTKQKEALQRRLGRLVSERGVGANGTPEDIFARLTRFLPPGAALVDLMKMNVWRSEGDGKAKLSRASEYHAFIFAKLPSGALTTEVVQLGSAEEIERHVTSWKRLVSSSRPTPSQASDRLSQSRRLFELVWVPIASRANGAKQIVVIPDGAFAAFPWAALQNPDSGKYIIEDGYAVATSLSIEHVVHLLSDRTPMFASDVLIVGDLDYGQAGADTTRAIVVGGVNILESTKWGALAGSREEINAITRLPKPGMKTVVLRGNAASERATAAAMGSARLIHFATHGYFSADPLLPDGASLGEDGVVPAQTSSGFKVRSSRNPLLRSGLILSGANRESRFEPGTIRIADGILTAEELSWFDLSRTELIVLSACETALGSAVRGEGTFGLERAFLLAGARTVVDSLWKIDDDITASLMKKFYEAAMVKKLPKLVALREAQLYVLRGQASASKSRVPVSKEGRQNVPWAMNASRTSGQRSI